MKSGTSTSRADFTFEQYCDSSDAVCVARFVTMSEPFMIEPVNGADPQYFTDLTFEVMPREAYEGDGSLSVGDYAGEGRVITVRQQGGSGKLIAHTTDSFATPEAGAAYLLFLYTICDGSQYNTEGEHYYLLGGNTGMWRLGAGGFACEATGKSVDMSQAKGACLRSLDDPPAKTISEKNREAERAELKEMYERGQFGEDDYNAYVNQLDEYAARYSRVMSKDEQEAYEESKAGMHHGAS